MGLKLSIYIDDETIDFVKARSKPDAPFGGIYRDMAKRGQVVLAHEIRALAGVFTEAEWQVILESLNGVLTDVNYITSIAINVNDNVNLNNAAERFGLTTAQGRELAQRVDDLSPGAKWAVLDVAERFRDAPERGENISPDAEGLKKLGIVCRDSEEYEH